MRPRARARSKKVSKETLDEKFRFAEDSFPGTVGGWNSQLRAATGVTDGEHYLLRLFKKTGTPLDDDLRSLVARSLRRIRRVLSSRHARDILVEVLDVAEDETEIAIVMLDPGSPISGSTQRTRARQGRFLVSTERRLFWRNIARIAEGLTLCHDAGIVHGAISPQAIFSHSDDREDYRLGGYEACVHLDDAGLLGATHDLLRPPGAISFRQDWIDLGRTAAAILGTNSDNGPNLLSIERRMLERLASPPQFQLFDGRVVLPEIAEIVAEIDRIGSSAEGELVLYPSRQVLQSDLPALTSGTVAAHDTDAVLRFAEEDLQGSTVRAALGNRDMVRVVTDLSVYTIKVVDDRTGMIVAASKRRPDDRSAFEATDLVHRLHLCRNRGAADERIRKLGLGAKRWAEIQVQDETAARTDDSPIWYALLLLEAFTLLREQFRIYPVEVVKPSPDDDDSVVWIVPRAEADRDARRTVVGLHPATEALKRELDIDDGRTSWTLSRVTTLAGERSRLPQLKFEGSGIVGGKRAYAFTASETTGLAEYRYLRPGRDNGSERAVRRRLQNIVAARNNLELLRALDDPTQVAFDEALRDISSPGLPPQGMDASKTAAWNSIAEGKSINVVVGPPGVGKTYLISHLVKSMLSSTPDARILVSAQNHDTLIHMEDELSKALPASSTIVVRVERSRSSEDVSSLRDSSSRLLRLVAKADTVGVMVNQQRQIAQALNPVDGENAIADRVFRDTDSLLLRSADVTLATTSSPVIEEMIADGDQFDWAIVEEAARANGAELIGALLLGNRRIMIGDHNQLSPFDVVERQKFYDEARATELLRDARKQLSTISDLPPEVDTALNNLTSDASLLRDVLATASRLEEPFRSIAEREAERERDTGRPSSILNTLHEQSRMHPAICELVSNTFYKGTLVSSDRVKQRTRTVRPVDGFPQAPDVVLDLHARSVVKKGAFEVQVKRSYRNETEAIALLAALQKLHPQNAASGVRPTLAILSPYLAQVLHLERLLKQQIDTKSGTLFGFASPRGNGKFIFTSDSFQGSEADVILASLVRNNVLVGSRALGFVKSPQRMNVLLSRARQKLVLATSLQFISDTVDGVDPDRLGGELGFLRTMVGELDRLSGTQFDVVGAGAATIRVDEHGRMKP